MTKFKPYLPGVLAYISEEIGEDVAVRLAKARGGREVYIARAPKEDGEIAKIVGLDAALKLSGLLGHGTLMVPCGNIVGAGGRRVRIRHRIEDLWQQGMTHAQIAAEVDVHTRTVERVVSALKDSNQSEFSF